MDQLEAFVKGINADIVAGKRKNLLGQNQGPKEKLQSTLKDNQKQQQPVSDATKNCNSQ